MPDKVNRILQNEKRRKSLEKRLWAKVERRGEDECWPWIAKATAAYGYGRMTAGRGCQVRAHRAAYALTYGPIPDGLHVCHRCDNTKCCNPKHLFLGTAADNIRDAKEKGRMSPPTIRRGIKHHAAFLTDAQVREIRRSNLGTGLLSERYGISTNGIRRIKKFEVRAEAGI